MSCSYLFVPKSIKNSYTFCDRGAETGLDSLINISGYYYADVFDSLEYDEYLDGDLEKSYEKKSGATLYFFPDGRVAFSIWHYEHLQEVIDSENLSKKELGRDYFDWGNYEVNRDSITVQYVHIPYGNINETWSSHEFIFKIKKNNTIVLLFSGSLDKPDYHYSYTKGQNNKYEYSDFFFKENLFYPESDIPKRFKKVYECK